MMFSLKRQFVASFHEVLDIMCDAFTFCFQKSAFATMVAELFVSMLLKEKTK